MTLLAWLWTAVWPNIVASILWTPLALGGAWFWKIKPHFARQRAHREQTAAQLAALHAKIDNPS